MKEIIVNSQEPTRLNVFLRNEGIGSRRTIDDYITNNFVTVNGVLATLGTKVSKKDVVRVKHITKDLIYALYHKPRGEVTGKITDLPGCEPLGRLDKESEGLLLYSNDYRVVDAILNPKHNREKEYEIVVREKATPRVIALLKKGIRTQETTYAPVKSVAIYGEGHSLRIILTEGKKHEIRRMLNALNLTVVSLKRVRIMSFVLRGVKAKTIHILNPQQIKTLLTECGINTTS